MAYTDYSQLFSQGEQKYGLRPGTGAALGYLESRYNPQATSPKGAMGLLQLMPGTAHDMGVANAYDPAANADGGLHYFSNILNGPAKGDYRTAAMMYNAGPNRTSFPQSSQEYADQFMGRLPVQQSVQPSPGGQMPPSPSLGTMAGMNSLAPQQPLDQMPQSLGDLASSMPQGNVPTRQPSKFTAGNILGVLGDALSAYGGRQPTFGPFLQQQAMMDKQQAFEREKFNAQLQMQMYAMLHPAEFMQAKAFQGMPGPDQRNYLKFLDATHPEYSMTPVGQVLNKRVSDPPSDAVAHLRGAIGAGADKASEITKFNQIFGPGAAEEALGAQ